MRRLRISFLAVMSGALLLVPGLATAEDDICGPPATGNSNQHGGVVVLHSSLPGGPDGSLDLHLVLKARADGTLHASGRVRSGGTNSVVFDDAKGSCADIDEDGTSGIVGLTLTGRQAGTRTAVPVIVGTLGTDIDSSGIYEFVMVVGEETRNGEFVVVWHSDR